jgi:DNA-binding CsgD family transcriptional regulator
MNSLLLERLQKANLSHRDRKIMDMRLGINQKAHSLQEIGNYFGISRERIRQLEKKVYETLGVGSSKDSIEKLQETRIARDIMRVIDIYKIITPIRLQEQKDFTTIAKENGFNYKDKFFKLAIKRFYKTYPVGTPEAEILSPKDREMVQYKIDNPKVTQMELAKMFNTHTPKISRKFARLGIVWTDVRSLEDYTRPIYSDRITATQN